MRRLTDDTSHHGATITVEHRTGRRWRITVTTDRVLMWVEFDALSRGRLAHTGQTELRIDGQRTRLAANYEHFLMLLADPDNPDFGRSLDDDLDAPAADPATAPEEIRTIFQAIQKTAAAHPDMPAPVLRHIADRWLLDVQHPRTRLMIRIFERYDIERPTHPPDVWPSKKLHLTLDGVDYSQQVGGNIEKALGMAAQHLTTPYYAPHTGATRPAAVTATGVQVRQTTVIRT